MYAVNNQSLSLLFGSYVSPPRRSLCRNAKAKCESVLGIVGLQWPEDSDCSQFPEEGGNATCLLPEAGVDGTDSVVLAMLPPHPPNVNIFIHSFVSMVTECSPSHFKCRSGRCVLATKRCDGHLDCDDHSDEDNCGETFQNKSPPERSVSSSTATPTANCMMSRLCLRQAVLSALCGSVLAVRCVLKPV